MSYWIMALCFFALLVIAAKIDDYSREKKRQAEKAAEKAKPRKSFFFDRLTDKRYEAEEYYKFPAWHWRLILPDTQFKCTHCGKESAVFVTAVCGLEDTFFVGCPACRFMQVKSYSSPRWAIDAKLTGKDVETRDHAAEHRQIMGLIDAAGELANAIEKKYPYFPVDRWD